MRSSALILALCTCLACGDQDADVVHTPYEDGRVVLAEDGNSRVSYVSTEGCVPASGTCVPVEPCEGPLDVIVDAAGDVRTVCYAVEGGHQLEVMDDGPQDVSDSGRAITFDRKLNGKPLGALSASGSDTVIWGNGPGATRLQSLVISGSDSRVRGVRVQGSTQLSASGASMVGSVLEGDLLLSGSDALVADTYVLGNVTISGSDASLIRVGIGGSLKATGDGLSCDRVLHWEDDGDGYYARGEEGDALPCP